MSWGLNCSQVHGPTLRSVARPNSPLWVKGPLEEQTIDTGVYDAWTDGASWRLVPGARLIGPSTGRRTRQKGPAPCLTDHRGASFSAVG